MRPFLFDDESTHTPEACAAALYRSAYRRARQRLRDGLHPDAIRLDFLLMEGVVGVPLGPETWAGIEAALAGLPPSPAA